MFFSVFTAAVVYLLGFFSFRVFPFDFQRKPSPCRGNNHGPVWTRTYVHQTTGVRPTVVCTRWPDSASSRSRPSARTWRGEDNKWSSTRPSRLYCRSLDDHLPGYRFFSFPCYCVYFFINLSAHSNAMGVGAVRTVLFIKKHGEKPEDRGRTRPVVVSTRSSKFVSAFGPGPRDGELFFWV